MSNKTVNPDIVPEEEKNVPEEETAPAAEKEQKPERKPAAKKAATPYDPWSDMVSIKIPRDRNNKEDVQVIVNGRRFVIMRGVDVDVPRPVFEALRDQEEAQIARDAFIDANEIKATKD